MRAKVLGMVVAAAFAATGGARAADVVSPVTPDVQPVVTESGWTFVVAPYFWRAGLNGQTSQFGSPVVDIDQSFGDILGDLDFGAMAIVEARKDRFSIFSDLQYVKISTGDTTPLGILAARVDLFTSTFVGTLGAGYSLLQSDRGRLDLAVGARVWSVDTDLSFTGGILDGVQLDDGATWVDGLVGLRGNYDFTPKLYVTGWGLIGAGEADLDWDVAGALGYRFTDRISAVAGYRAIGVDYSNDDGFMFDVVEHGPIIGAVFRF